MFIAVACIANLGETSRFNLDEQLLWLGSNDLETMAGQTSSAIRWVWHDLAGHEETVLSLSLRRRGEVAEHWPCLPVVDSFQDGDLASSGRV
jgi:hypothetical protein